jgi:threonine/homoserine/homoserine lactone efflux protein
VPAERAAEAKGSTLIQAYTSAVALTLTNPTTILSFVAIFAGLGAGTTGRGGAGAAALVLGVLLGSALWWVILSGGVALVRERVTPRTLRGVNYLSGAILLGFGIVALASLH